MDFAGNTGTNQVHAIDFRSRNSW